MILLKYELPLTSETKQALLSGNAIFTIAHKNTHYTFSIKRNKEPAYYSHSVYFAYEYTKWTKIGSIVSYRNTFKPFDKVKDYKHVVAFTFIWQNMGKRLFPPTVKLYHAGKCLRCGALLTTPESILIGLGPICAEKGYS